MKQYPLKTIVTSKADIIDFEKELNPQQLQVVTAGNGPILVIAGAGSGKTRTVIYRLAYLVKKGVSPSSILLLTFTNKSAREMLRRAEVLTGLDTHLLWGGTFHHIGNTVLRREAKLLGYEPNYTILDREDSKDLIEECVSELGLNKPKYFPKGSVLNEIFSFAINTDQELPRAIEKNFHAFFEITDDIVRAFNRYTYKKQELNVMDFDDLLVNWKKLLVTNPDVKELYRQRFRYILVDEYQDTNKIQADVTELLVGENGNLMVVGDDSQSIYSFRGATFTNIIDFPKRFPNATILKLETNYRSTPEILTLANSSIKYNKRQFQKTLTPIKSPGPIPELVINSDVNEQARFVCQRILELHNDEGIDLGDIAVLYRSHYHSLEIQMELTRLNIPFQVRSGLRFFEQAHVKDVASYLKIIANPRDELAWKRVMKLYPKIGKSTAEKVWKVLTTSDNPLQKFKSSDVKKVLSKNAQKGWEELVNIIELLSRRDLNKSPSQMIEIVLTNGYENYLTLNFPNSYSRIEDIKQLANYALQYDSLDKFLAELALLSNVYGEDITTGIEEKDIVILSTVHQAKGLEWKVVFIIWLTDGKFPDRHSFRELGDEDLEEERRLFYVAVTRAKEQLILTYPTMSHEYSSLDVIQRPSRFIKELDEGAYEKVTITYEGNNLNKLDAEY